MSVKRIKKVRLFNMANWAFNLFHFLECGSSHRPLCSKHFFPFQGKVVSLRLAIAQWWRQWNKKITKSWLLLINFYEIVLKCCNLLPFGLSMHVWYSVQSPYAGRVKGVDKPKFSIECQLILCSYILGVAALYPKNDRRYFRYRYYWVSSSLTADPSLFFVARIGHWGQ